MIKTKMALLLSFLFVFLNAMPGQVSAVSCPCKFDTDNYSAIAEGEGYCSATTEEGKHCTVIFNGRVDKTAKIESSSVYGSFDKYVRHLETINMDLRSVSPMKLMSKSEWPLENLPLMIRSSYAATPSINNEEREALDSRLKAFFDKFGKKIPAALSGHSPISDKDFRVEKGKLKFTVKGISVRFAIFAYP
ncbi:hypothetical protein KA005_58785 [bacterium]|nr:hypothetical protein [bacterium]